MRNGVKGIGRIRAAAAIGAACLFAACCGVLFESDDATARATWTIGVAQTRATARAIDEAATEPSAIGAIEKASPVDAAPFVDMGPDESAELGFRRGCEDDHDVVFEDMPPVPEELPTVPVRGVLVDADGKPIPNAALSFFPARWNAAESAVDHRCTTDSRGRFDTRLEWRGAVAATASYQTTLLAATTFDCVDGGVDLRIVAPRPRSIALRIFKPNGDAASSEFGAFVRFGGVYGACESAGAAMWRQIGVDDHEGRFGFEVPWNEDVIVRFDYGARTHAVAFSTGVDSVAYVVPEVGDVSVVLRPTFACRQVELRLVPGDRENDNDGNRLERFVVDDDLAPIRLDREGVCVGRYRIVAVIYDADGRADPDASEALFGPAAFEVFAGERTRVEFPK
jgi:hypothetical protein